MMEALIAGLVGAFAVSGLMLYYNHLTQQKQMRSAATIDIISWADDIYDRLITILAQRDATFTGTPFGLSNDEYRTIVKEAKAMLLASKVRAKVALVYGNGPELMKFDALHNEFVEITETILNANRDTWSEINQKVSERFSNSVEPLMKSVEAMLISGTMFPAINRTLLAPQAPVLYLPHNDKDVTLRKTQQGGAVAFRDFASWQLAKIVEAFFDSARLVFVLFVIGMGAWIYYGRPDISWLFFPARSAQTQQDPQALAIIRPELCIESPRSYGLDAATDVVGLPSGSVLTVGPENVPLKLCIRNNRPRDLVNVVFMLSLPEAAMTVQEYSWKPSWQELQTRSKSWLLMNVKDDIKAGKEAEITPFVVVRFPRAGEYKIMYKYFADNLQPQTGYFLVRATD